MQEIRESFVVTSTLAGILVLAGCATNYMVEVDALKSSNVEEPYESFHIVSADPEIDREVPQFEAVSKYLKAALSGKGMYEAPDGETADLIIEVSFGIGDPEIEFEEISVPADGYPGMYVLTEVVPITIYGKFLRISARDNKEIDQLESLEEVWHLYISARDKSSDLEKYLPLLVAAGQDFMGQETKGQVRVKIKDESDAVVFIKGGT